MIVDFLLQANIEKCHSYATLLPSQVVVPLTHELTLPWEDKATLHLKPLVLATCMIHIYSLVLHTLNTHSLWVDLK